MTDAAQGRPLSWKKAIKRARAVAVAGAAIYLMLSGLIAVLVPASPMSAGLRPGFPRESSAP